ncbi:male sterility protein-domain-containing protein [Halteromyces radiatus]|uniref:male sterility protein-domain-containing protein n=1 Tax=Halteromyces radiatus TaxID=101107 RepID=UPI00221EAA63|nr:male sterility protein-domain-containing protein [Halteromyces radiatus]KAI8086697.1 male sterility protein-domain-containing protein [Halteromyces radiatus]
MTLVPTISITTPDLESKDFIMNSPLSPSAPQSPTIFDVVKNMDDMPELGSDDELALDQPIITEEPQELQDHDHLHRDTQQQEEEQQKNTVISQDVRQFYHNKSILITGATGFIGKAVFWKLLHSLHGDIDRIFLLIRMGPSHRRLSNPIVRLQEEILSNKAFISLRRQMGTTVFDQLIREKVVPINGDFMEHNLGLSTNDHTMLVKHVNVILHCAGNMDGNERLDISVKVNAAGTNSLINLANECGLLSSFVHLSPLQIYGSSGVACDRVGILPEESSVEDIIDHIVESNLEDLPVIMNQVRPYYQNVYTFSKALAEQVLVSDVRKKQITNSQQFPIGIIRLGHIGPSVSEPLKGWADEVNGANGVILLTGRGTRIIDTNHGDMTADVIPVDFAVRTIIACAATMTPPPTTFVLPMTDDTKPDTTPERTSSTPTIGNNRDSTSSYSSTGTAATLATAATEPANEISGRPSQSSSTGTLSMNYHAEDCFPYIYHVSATGMRAITWRLAYEAMRHYWTRTTGINLAPANSYFTASAQGLSRARTVMNSLRSAASVYISNTTTTNTGNNGGGDSNGWRSARPSSKRSSHRMSKSVDKAARLAPNVMRTYTAMNHYNNNNYNKKSQQATSLLLYHGGPWIAQLKQRLREDTASEIFDPYILVPEDADTVFWMNYFTNSSYGMHYFVGTEPNVRLPTAAIGWSCALQFQGAGSNDAHGVIDHQVRSEIYSPDQMNKRTYRMMEHLKHLLVQDEAAATQQQQKDEVWLVDVDDSLEDWSQDQTVINAEHDKRLVLGKWRKKVGSNDDAVKVVVLNDKRVNQAIHQITQNAGVSKQTAVNEAMKILIRMSERTQLTFVWFTGSFLKSFFDHMFESVRISEESIRYIRDSTLGKRVVYVPVSKSILDPLLVWYISIRYHLPVPALVCDEVMAQLGPISDIYRLAGAYYVKRDKHQRSPLNSAVTAAYTQVLLREHGALSMCLEKSRSRTGKYQEAFDDEMIDMVMESTLQSNQSRTSTSTVSKVANSDLTSPPESPASPATPTSTTTGMDASTTGSTPRKAHRDVMIVPINISYEIVPELGFLIDQVLDQQPKGVYMGNSNNSSNNNNNNTLSSMSGNNMPSTRSSPLLASQAPSSPLPNMVRPSQAMDRRNRLLDGIDAPKKCGRVHVGIGQLISIQDVAAEYNKSSSDKSDEQSNLANIIVKRIQHSQHEALVVTPLSLVCAIILYGRATGGVCLGKIKELLDWLRIEILERQYKIDWQDGEDLEAIIFSVFKLINEPKNLIIEGKEMTDDTNIKVNDHADNIMTLSYYSNQIVDIFLLDAFFSVIYLSFSEDTVSEDEFIDRFRFLVQLLENEFVLTWDVDKQFKTIMSRYEKEGVIRKKENNQLSLKVNMETSHVRYEQLIFLASLIYPTIDTYWITSCSLSALERVPTLPRSIVPLLSQWIATHLIAGRRTIYREVLSTESSRMAVDVFMAMGFLTEFKAKEKLSPDAQILLHELKIPTTETLIELCGQNSDGGMTPVSPIDPEGMMKALMAQIQMNRANSNMADLCQQIDSYRLGAASQRESFQNAQVFQKCLKQIKGILQVDVSFAKKQKVDLNDAEDGLVQLVYALRVNSTTSNDRSTRRISEAYNLK